LVTAPYHNQKKAFLCKAELDYQKYEQTISLSKTIENTALDDDDLALKISHHPDGFLQFSGNGVTSGKNPDGTPKGIGIQSWPLSSPPRGPAFGVAIKNYQDMAQSTRPDVEELCVDFETISGDDNDTNIIVEGFFIPKELESRIYRENNLEYISIADPSGIIIKLHVVRPTKTNRYFGFIGLHIYIQALDAKWKDYEYIFSTSTGNLGFDGNTTKATGLYAMYPNNTNQKLPSLNWPSQ
jgi:hypothetical protein